LPTSSDVPILSMAVCWIESSTPSKAFLLSINGVWMLPLHCVNKGPQLPDRI
jgi:hypothetical protein